MPLLISSIVGLLLLLALGMPIYVVFGIIGIIVLLIASPATIPGIPIVIWSMGTNFAFISILLFVLMGTILAATPVGRRLYGMAYVVFGSRPGGLAMSTTGACTLFGAMCGSAYATTATFGMFAFREMKDRGYDSSFASGAIVGAATLAPIIPPSISLIIYGSVSGESIGDLFMAGIIPGIILAALFIGYQAMAVRRNPALGPGMREVMPAKEKLLAVVGALPSVALIAIVIGSLYIGFASPSEVAALGSVGAVVLAIIYARGIDFKMLSGVFLTTVKTTGFIVLLMITGKILALALSAMGLSEIIASGLAGVPAWGVVPIFVLVIIGLGFFMDGAAILILATPIMYPVVLGLGFDPITFGIIFAMAVCIGVFTPPVALSCYILQGITKEPLFVIIRGCIPYIYMTLIAIALLVAFPWLATLLL